MKLDRIHITLLVLLGLAACVIIFKGCGSNDTVLSNVVNGKDTAFHKTTKGIDESFNKSVVLETQAQLKLLVANNDTLKKLISQFKNVSNTVVIKEHVRIERDTIPFIREIPCVFDPIPFRKENKNYMMFGRVDNKHVFVDSMTIPNKQTLILGEKKTGLFKSERQVHVVNSNALIHTDQIQNLTVVEKKKWWERPGPWAVVGAATAIAGRSLIQTFLFK